MTTTFHTEWSTHVPVAVVNDQTGQRFWFDELDDAHKTEALACPVYDLNRGRYVQEDGRRLHSFIMNRKFIKF